MHLVVDYGKVRSAIGDLRPSSSTFRGWLPFAQEERKQPRVAVWIHHLMVICYRRGGLNHTIVAAEQHFFGDGKTAMHPTSSSLRAGLPRIPEDNNRLCYPVRQAVGKAGGCCLASPLKNNRFVFTPITGRKSSSVFPAVETKKKTSSAAYDKKHTRANMKLHMWGKVIQVRAV